METGGTLTLVLMLLFRLAIPLAITFGIGALYNRVDPSGSLPHG